MQTAIKFNQDRNFERTHIRAMLRKMFLDINKDVFKLVDERAKERIEKKKLEEEELKVQ